MRQIRIMLSPHAPLDVRAAGIVASAPNVGVDGLRSARASDLYFVRGELTDEAIQRLCEATLSDPAAHELVWVDESAFTRTDGVEVAFIPGVMDPLALQLARAAQEIGLPPIDVATGTRYELDIDPAAEKLLAERLLYNPTVQRYALGRIVPEFATGSTSTRPRVESIPLQGLDDQALVTLSRNRLLSLSADEMRAIQGYFEEINRAPTDIELEALAQTWSEHCVHKTFKAVIDYTNADGKTEIVDGLLKSTIRAATEKINAPWVRSAFVDNAGIIAFDETYDLSFKVETHNHPSALEPFGGANTGVGGVIRDVMGVSARPIAVTDVLCFGPQDLPFDQLPAGTLHPRRVREGVVSGVQDYGNKLGLPTVSGAIYYDPGYTANPLVFAGCVGIAPRGSHPTGARPGDRVIVLGGRTGRDGLHGATFSSDTLAHDTGQVAGTAVQIGNPIVQKDVMEVLLRARDQKLYTAITDCGAGGLSSAVGEMAQHPGGVDVELSDVPLKYPGLQPWEIWLSEAQERMVVAIPSENWPALEALCNDWDVEATDIGAFTNTGRLVVRYGGTIVADLDLNFLHEGLPRLRLKATASKVQPLPTSTAAPETQLLQLLANPNIASKEDVIRRYDHEIHGGTVIKPMIGVHNDGPSDAAVMKPLDTPGHNRGYALGIGLAVELGKYNAPLMGRTVVLEAVNNIIAVGADPDQVALLDNFCWGDPKDPERLGTLVEVSRSCADTAVSLKMPFVSGKDSLNNTFLDLHGQRTSIPDTLMISSIGFVPDVTQTVSMDLKQAGNTLYLYADEKNLLESYRALFRAIQNGSVRSCHDVSDGGTAVALAEMCLAGQLGAKMTLSADVPLFYSYPSAFLIEAATQPDLNVTAIGEVTAAPRLQVTVGDQKVIDLPISELTAAFKREGSYAL